MNEIKVGDSVRLESNVEFIPSDWWGTTIHNWETLKNTGPFNVTKVTRGQRDNDAIHLADKPTNHRKTWLFPKYFEKVTKMKKKMKIKKNKFKVGDRVTTSRSGQEVWIGKIIKRVSIKERPLNYKVSWDSNCPGNSGSKVKTKTTWHACSVLYKSATVAETADLKSSLERKVVNVKPVKSKAIPKTRRFSKKKVAKKVAKKTRSKKSKTKEGYVVRALMKNGAAKKAGVLCGDVITNVAGKPIKASGALGKVLRTFKKGAKVSVTVKRLDGRTIFLKRVVLGSNSAGRASLGVISGKKKASSYNTKVVTEIKKIAKDTTALTKEVLSSVPENEFMKRAREEMEGVGALMADMKGRDALLKARDLKRKLHGELRGGLSDNTKLVNDYLNRLKNESEVKPDEKPKKRLSTKGKIVFGFLSLSAFAASAAAVAHFALGLI